MVGVYFLDPNLQIWRWSKKWVGDALRNKINGIGPLMPDSNGKIGMSIREISSSSSYKNIVLTM